MIILVATTIIGLVLEFVFKNHWGLPVALLSFNFIWIFYKKYKNTKNNIEDVPYTPFISSVKKWKMRQFIALWMILTLVNTVISWHRIYIDERGIWYMIWQQIIVNLLGAVFLFFVIKGLRALTNSLSQSR